MVPMSLLIDDIYEAAIVPEKWQLVLDRLAEIADAEGTLLFAAGPGEPRWLSSQRIHDAMAEWTESKWYVDNPRGQRLVPLTEPRFLTDFDGLTAEEIEASDFYTDWLRPNGLGWCVGTAIRSPAGDTLVFSIEKAHDKGPVPRAVAEQLDPLRPHLARAALLSARLGLDRARAAATSLGLLGLPAAVLRRGGQVMAANAQLERLMPDVMQDRRDRVALTSETADALLARALAAFEHGLITPDVRSIPVTAQRDHPPMIVHLVPIRGAAHDVFTQAIAILIVTPVVQAEVPTPELLQGLFDLTPAEARVARGIGEGRTVETIAAAFGTSRETVRNQLKAVMAKTGLRRQVELAGLLAGNKLPLNPGTE